MSIEKIKESYKEVVNYINLEEKNPCGCSRLAPMIKMINEDLEIVEELLDKTEFLHKTNLLFFLDCGLQAIIKWRYSNLDLDSVFNAIVYVLDMFNKLENKWEINGEQWKEYLLKNWED